jgi:hypothetical protein
MVLSVLMLMLMVASVKGSLREKTKLKRVRRWWCY